MIRLHTELCFVCFQFTKAVSETLILVQNVWKLKLLNNQTLCLVQLVMLVNLTIIRHCDASALSIFLLTTKLWEHIYINWASMSSKDSAFSWCDYNKQYSCVALIHVATFSHLSDQENNHKSAKNNPFWGACKWGQPTVSLAIHNSALPFFSATYLYLGRMGGVFIFAK